MTLGIKHPSWRKAAILKMLQLAYIRERSSHRDETLRAAARHNASRHKQLKIRISQNLRWRTAAILNKIKIAIFSQSFKLSQ